MNDVCKQCGLPIEGYDYHNSPDGKVHDRCEPPMKKRIRELEAIIANLPKTADGATALARNQQKDTKDNSNAN